MYRLYQKDEVAFALVWIAIYCLVSIPIRGRLGDQSPYMLIALALIAAGLTVFIRKHRLQGRYGLDHWPRHTARFLYFIPVWILVTGNLWGGISLAYTGLYQVCAVLSMLLIGYIEEVIFRGFLFKGMLPKDGPGKSIIIVAITFGIGHIVNLFAGQANLETIAQVCFAIAWGFIMTVTFYKSQSLLPCILAHGLIDAFSTFSRENPVMEWAYIIATIFIALVYCSYLLRLPDTGKALPEK
ncbi:CPBP family intramembrane glutamic endopeptidase [Peptococcus simiae]|uniref:CPBP family intramembrane glutamic endopeptidase n=1 Tax=Peptococcus simiae TaxID=1643805 RepID=A0ABW9GYY6_9FIRM